MNITDIVGASGGDVQRQATITDDDAAGIPTTSTWALLAMAILLALGGAIATRSA